ncbi:MAG: hypothetical protein L0154_20775 [Chloroflexi bacterium]|nr:hypothetical protein [Chloroflexota bacterium]
MKDFVLMSIHWADVIDKGLVPSLNLPDPYQPILVFYERGGQVERRSLVKEFIITDGDSYRLVKRECWPNATEGPLASLEKDYLDQLDEEPLPEQD